MKTLFLLVVLFSVGCQTVPCPEGFDGGPKNMCRKITIPWPVLTSPGRNVELTVVKYGRHFYREYKFKEFCNKKRNRKIPECKPYLEI